MGESLNHLSNIEKTKIFFTEILEKGDFTWVDSIFSDMFGIKQSKESDTPISDKKGTGKIGIKLYLNTFIQAFENAKYTLLNIVESENQVIIRWKIHAKHVGDIFSIKASNKVINVVGVSWFFFDSNNLIENIHLIWNGFSLIDQLNLEVRKKE